VPAGFACGGSIEEEEEEEAAGESIFQSKVIYFCF
jgi:hypothetical protein